jgi:hypothetical protein
MRRALGAGASGLAVAAMVLAGGCGSSDDDDDTAASPPPATTAAPTPTPTPTATTTVTPTPTVTATATAPPGETVTRTVTAAPPAAPPPVVPPPPVPPPASPTSSPAAVVQAYYDAINARDYARAWELGGKNLAGSYSEFAARFSDTAYDGLTIVGVQGGVVTMRLDAVQTDGGHRYFAGTYTVRGGEIVAANVQQTGSVPGFAYYSRCADARAAGVAPIKRDEPGYRMELDRDRDGVACEPPPDDEP